MVGGSIGASLIWDEVLADWESPKVGRESRVTLGGVVRVGVGRRGGDDGGLTERGVRGVVKEGVELRQEVDRRRQKLRYMERCVKGVLERWSRGRAPDCQSRGRWFNPPHTAILKLRQFRSPHICVCLSEETLKTTLKTNDNNGQ